MCGISGVVSGKVSLVDFRAILLCMIDAMDHRGPDGSGIHTERGCGLGHRRLAVIDTSAAGSQPMTRDGVTLVYNGELYNFQEKRSVL